MINGYKVVDFKGASRDITTKQTVAGIYKECKDAVDNKIPIRDINMMLGTVLTKKPTTSNYNRAYMDSTNVVIEVGGGKIATVGTDDGVTFSTQS